jgi:UDP-N-acetylmuramate: L-alanyl-gamma-D-glutamyl-meso-diaminopimelate ligase
MYVEQFKMFIDKISASGKLIFCADDPLVAGIAMISRPDVENIPYQTHPYEVIDDDVYLLENKIKYPVQVFGKHNMQNISAAQKICTLLGVTNDVFYKAIGSFKGASKRLQLIASNNFSNIYFDFAHSPSKLTATVKAVKEHFPDRKLVACIELHTFSSLSQEFLQQYYGTMEKADTAIVYYNPHAIEAKRLKPLAPETVAKSFGTRHLVVFTTTEMLTNELRSIEWKGKNLLLMSSGNFGGLDVPKFANSLLV